MNVNIPIRAKGRFKLIKHTGHKFDEAGRVLEWGRVIEETALADNVFTYYGSAALLGRATNTISLTVSSSIAAPTLDGPGPVVGPVYSRLSTALVSTDFDRNLTPDEFGFLWWRKSYRFNFPAIPPGPDLLQGPIVDLYQCFANASGSSVIGSSTAPISVAFLQGPSGENSPITVDTANEDFDVVWEFTEYVPASVTHSITGITQDGGGELLDTQTYTCVVRPANFDNSAEATQGWFPLEDEAFPGTFLGIDSLRKVGLGTLGFFDTEPTFTEFFVPESAVLDGVVVGQVSNALTVMLGFGDTTTTEEINCAQFFMGHTEWQVSFDPPIAKQARHRLRIRFSVSVVDRADT